MEEEELPSTIYSIISIYNTMYKESKDYWYMRTGEQDSMQGGIIHFSFGILAAYIIYLSGGVV